MKTICVLTANRAEYGLLSPIIHLLMAQTGLKTNVAVTGAHLANEFGLTYKEIEDEGVKIDKKIEILLGSDSGAAVSKSMGLAMIGFADYLAQSRPNALLVLGDRYETLAVCCAAVNEKIPIIHLYGGETTQGAADEAFRHSITKMSSLHLTSAEEYKKRVIQLGENPKTVLNIGAIGVENALKIKPLTKPQLEKSLGFELNKPYAVVTFHPATLEQNTSETQVNELLKALSQCKDMKFIITGANSDSGGRQINKIINEYAAANKNVLTVSSLGAVRYLSALKYAKMVIGNSSSGIVEVPSFKIPTINIGDRQKGRVRAESIIDCKPCAKSICAAIKKAGSQSFLKKCETTLNPFAQKNTCKKIVAAIMSFLKSDVDLKKKFYDINRA